MIVSVAGGVSAYVLAVDASAQRGEVSALVADDDDQNAALLVRILEHGGFGRVTSTTSSAEVVGLCEREKPDLLLLDISMPEPNGFEILEALADTREAPTVVILTGHEHPSIERRALELGAAAMVGKTSSREELLARLDDVLAGAGR